MKKNIWLISLILTIMLLGSGIINYHRAAYASNAAHNEQSGEKSGHGGGHEGHSAPMKYYIYWLILLVCVYRSGKFLMEHHKAAKEGHNNNAVEKHEEHKEQEGHGHHPQPTGLDKMLVAGVVVMFFFENTASMSQYHMPNGIGFIMFVLKFVLGVSLMTYGILGMGEH